MSRYSIALLGAGIVLVACNPAAKSDSEAPGAVETCTRMIAGDPEIVTDLGEIGSSVEAYCACYGAMITLEPEADQAAILKVSAKVADLREENGTGLGDAAELIEEDAEGETSEARFDITSDEFEVTGDFVDGVRSEISENNGVCPVKTEE